MKKRIKDLTEEELKQICNKSECGFQCPFNQNNICTMTVLKAVAGTNFLDREVDIPQKHILDKEEHDYLRAVIKPYKAKYIRKLETQKGNQYIEIGVKSSVYCGLTASWSMPLFEKGTMYKNTEVDKEYTIEELELDKEWEE